MRKTNTHKYRMVALDTSSTVTGFAYYEAGELVNSGVLDCTKEKDAETRLENMCTGIIDYLNKCKPETIVIEMTVVPRNAHSQRLLSEIVGVVRGWALVNGTEFVRLRPSEWRKLLCGPSEKTPRKREECKLWSIEKVKDLYGKVVNDNESDAILLGQARINMFCA